MTIVVCPHGCGGTINTATDNFCRSCRRGLNETEIIWKGDTVVESPVVRKLSWCWEWWGPAHHRMRCRLPLGHDGEHDTHESRGNSMIVTTDGEVIGESRKP